MRRVEQRPIVTLDHLHARACDTRRLEHGGPLASVLEMNVERRSKIRAGVAIPAASIAGAHTRLLKLAMSCGWTCFAVAAKSLWPSRAVRVVAGCAAVTRAALKSPLIRLGDGLLRA